MTTDVWCTKETNEIHVLSPAETFLTLPPVQKCAPAPWKTADQTSLNKIALFSTAVQSDRSAIIFYVRALN